jgi:alanine racemase
VLRLEPGEGTGYGQTYVASEPGWIGIVPVGYGDGFRRDLEGTEVLVGDERCRAVGAVSMDAFAVALPAELPAGTPVTLIGDGVLAEEHARVAETINYEIVCRVNSSPERAIRTVVDA